MSQEIIKTVQKTFMTKKVPVIKPGYTVEVDTIIREGNKQRIQKFKGMVIAITGRGSDALLTVRKISYGVGVEKKLPIFSPNVGAIKVIKTEPTKRSKLYFMRDRVGKNAMRIKKGKASFIGADDELEMMEDYTVMEVAPEVEEVAEETPVVENVEASPEVVAEEVPVEEVVAEKSAEETPEEKK